MIPANYLPDQGLNIPPDSLKGSRYLWEWRKAINSSFQNMYLHSGI